MRRPVLVVCALLVAGAGVMLRLRAQWIERKIAAATIAPGDMGGPAPGCARDGGTVIITGDSRIAQWPMRLLDGLAVTNTGIAGETALQLTARLERDVLACRPRAVLIATGVNDLVAASLASDDEARTIVARLPDLLIALAETAARTGAAVSLATIVPPGQPDLLRRVVWSEAVRRYVADVNARLRTHRWPSGVTLLDFAAALDAENTGVLPQRFQRDTLHFNALAYACLTRLLPFVPLLTRPPSRACAPDVGEQGAVRDRHSALAKIVAGR